MRSRPEGWWQCQGARRGEGDGAVKDGGGSGGPGGEEIEGWSDGVDQAGRGWGGELMEGSPSKGQDRETPGSEPQISG